MSPCAEHRERSSPHLPSRGAWACIAVGPRVGQLPGRDHAGERPEHRGQLEDSITCLINEQRVAHGLRVGRSPTAPSSRPPRGTPHEMVARRATSPTPRPTGHDLRRPDRGDRLHAGRPQLAGRREPRLGQRSAQQPAAPIVKAWMNSPPHRENLLRRAVPRARRRRGPGHAAAPRDSDGVTVSSEYGFRTGGRRARASKAQPAQAAPQARAALRRRRAPSSIAGRAM